MEDDPNNANCNWVCPACASYERPRTHFIDPNNTSKLYLMKRFFFIIIYFLITSSLDENQARVSSLSTLGEVSTGLTR